jgi:hypothetical protein
MSRVTPLVLALAVLGLLGAGGHVHAASSQPVGIDAENRAKLARVKAVGNAMSRASASNGKSSGDGGDCSLEIGNVNTGGGRGRAPREVNIFIPGDIFQVNNRCR